MNANEQPCRPPWHILLPVIPILLSILIGRDSLKHDFVWDDEALIVENESIRSLRNIPTFFRPSYWRERFVGGKRYRPVRAISFAIDHALWGLRPRGYHLTNLVLRALCVAAAYGMMLSLTRSRRTAVIAASLYSVHPVVVESVDWTKNRSELLLCIFVVLSWLLLPKPEPERRARRRWWARYLLSVAAFVLALLSKETAVVFAVLLLCYAWLFVPRGRRKRFVWACTPFLVLSAAFVAFLFIATTTGGADSNSLEMAASRTLVSLPKILRHYFQLLLFPIHLSADRVGLPWRLPMWIDIAVSSVCVLLVACLGLCRRPRGAGSFAVLWGLVMLLPVAGLSLLLFRPLAEQRLYMPCIGFCVLLALGMERAFWRDGIRWRQCLGVVCTIALVGCLSVGYWERSSVWRSDYWLWSDTIAKAPNNPRAYFNLASYYERNALHDRAIAAYERTVDLSRNDPRVTRKAHTKLGLCYEQQERLDLALREHQLALAIEPGKPDLHNNLGICRLKRKETELATIAFEEALAKDADFYPARTNLAGVYHELLRQRPGDRALAGKVLLHATRSLEIAPMQEEAETLRGLCKELRAAGTGGE